MTTQELSMAFDTLVDYQVVTEEELMLVTAINGTNEQTLNDILYVRCGVNSFEQFMEELA